MKSFPIIGNHIQSAYTHPTTTTKSVNSHLSTDDSDVASNFTVSSAVEQVAKPKPARQTRSKSEPRRRPKSKTMPFFQLRTTNTNTEKGSADA